MLIEDGGKQSKAALPTTPPPLLRTPPSEAVEAERLGAGIWGVRVRKGVEQESWGNQR